MERRRAFQLPEDDLECLAARSLDWEAIVEGGVKWLLIRDYVIPVGYHQTKADVALRISPSYPDDQLDMVYFSPGLSLTSGRAIRQLSTLGIDGKTYQQWSRHRTAANPWRPGLDNVCSHL